MMLFSNKEWSWPLDNGIQASLLSDILTQEGIPHSIVRHGEALWGFAEAIAEGYGHLETSAEYHDQVEILYQDFLKSDAPDSENSD